MKPILLLFIGFTFTLNAFSQTPVYTDSEARADWNKLKQQPLTEASFRATCDLIQKIGKTNLNISYEIMQEYLPTLKKSGNKKWVHIILMSWAKAKESLHFFDEAEKLLVQARANASGTGKMYREALVSTILLYGEWNNDDSLNKYVDLAKKECIKAKDNENLSFVYTFQTMSDLSDTTLMSTGFRKAIAIAQNLPDKNALFTARYNFANIYLQPNPRKQVEEFESLLKLAEDSSLRVYPKKLYERTAFTFRNPLPSVYYQLMQLNLILSDYENASKFAALFYDATLKPNPNGVQAPYFNAELAILKSYQGDFRNAKLLLEKSKAQFKLPEEKIPYQSYFVAAGLIKEHERDYDSAEKYYKKTYAGGYSSGRQIMSPELLYAHILTVNHKLPEAEKIFAEFSPFIGSRKYTATGYYYHKYFAEFLKAKGNYTEYANTLNSAYQIKDSLANLNQYRAVQGLISKILMADKEKQLARQNEEMSNQEQQIRRERIYYLGLAGLAVITIGLLLLLLRNRNIRTNQTQTLHEIQLQQLEKQRDLDNMNVAMLAEEKERQKVSEQLHSEVNSLLAIASLNLTSVLEDGHMENNESKLLLTKEVIGSVSATIRNLSHQLNPLMIERVGFPPAIDDLADAINMSGRLQFNVNVVGLGLESKLLLPFLNDIYRIIQELVQNILKHAQASSASLEVVEHPDIISIIVEDNGIGMSADASAKSSGLETIRRKVRSLSGQIEISNRPEGGTIVIIELPVTSQNR